MAELKYKRVLLKLSGEALAGEQKTGIDPETVGTICKEIGGLLDMGVELALVIGGGNIFRGLSGSAKGMERSSADYMGMLATVLNALAVQDMLEKFGYPTRVLSAIDMQEVCEPFIRRRAMRRARMVRASQTGAPIRIRTPPGNATGAGAYLPAPAFCGIGKSPEPKPRADPARSPHARMQQPF